VKSGASPTTRRCAMPMYDSFSSQWIAAESRHAIAEAPMPDLRHTDAGKALQRMHDALRSDT
jgi:hypothetical protein